MAKQRSFDRDHVAEILLEALQLGLPITSTLVDVLGVSAGQAQYMIRVVKDDGLLGVEGHQVVVALLTRGASAKGEGRRILVCENCLTAWPCPKARPGIIAEPTGRQSRTHGPTRARTRR